MARQRWVKSCGRVDQRLLLAVREAKRSVGRGLGPPKTSATVEAVPLFNLGPADWVEEAAVPNHQARFVRIMTWWMLRELEAAMLAVSDVKMSEQRTLGLSFAMQKRDVAGERETIFLTCICDTADGVLRVSPKRRPPSSPPAYPTPSQDSCHAGAHAMCVRRACATP